MKTQTIRIVAVCLGGLLIVSATARATDDHGAQHGREIAERKIEAYTFRYVLLDLAQRNQAMKAMEGMRMHGMSGRADITNHLVVYLTGPDNRSVSGKVGFIVTDPSGNEYKTLTMGMDGGYGADIVLKTPGVHKIMTKAVIGEKTLMDEFEYSVK